MKVPNFAEVAGKVRQATPVFAALLSAAAATATLYLHVRDRRPRLHVYVSNTTFHRGDGTLVARSSDFAHRYFSMFNEGGKPVKVEEVRVELAGRIRGTLPADGVENIAAVRLDVYTDRNSAPIPGWLDQHYQSVSCSADLSEVERLLARQGHSGPTRVRLVVMDALGNAHGCYFEVLARSEEGPMSRMHKVLRERLKDRVEDASSLRGARVSRDEVEAMGEAANLTPDEAVRIFEELGYVVWRGEYEPYEPGNRKEWSGVWVTLIGSV